MPPHLPAAYPLPPQFPWQMLHMPGSVHRPWPCSRHPPTKIINFDGIKNQDLKILTKILESGSQKPSREAAEEAGNEWACRMHTANYGLVCNGGVWAASVGGGASGDYSICKCP